MKRTLSLVLALVMVLGTFTSVFAAEQSVEAKAGAFLKEVEVLAGNTEGDLMLSENLERRDQVILLSKLMKEFEIAKEFPTSEESPTWKDNGDKFYTPFLAWAQANEHFAGHSATKFGPREAITAQDYAAVLLRVLGYAGEDATKTYSDSLKLAKELGILSDVAELENSTKITRGQMSVMTFNALGVEIKDSKVTLAEKLEIKMPAPATLEVVNVTATNLKQIEVEFNNKVDENSAVKLDNYTFAEAFEMAELQEDGKTVVLTLKDDSTVLKNQKEYKLTVNNVLLDNSAIKLAKVEKKFVAIDNTIPTVKEVLGLGTKAIQVVFSEPVTKETASRMTSYKIDGKVVSGSIKYVYPNSVIISTSMTVGDHELSVKDVEDFAKFKVQETGAKFTIVEDTVAPEIVSVKSVDLKKVEVIFNEPVKSVSNGYHTSKSNLATRPISVAGNKVTLSFKNAMSLGNTTIFVDGVEDYSGNKADRSAVVVPELDITRPEVVAVDVKDGKTFTIAFNKDINVDGAQKAANYVIKNSEDKVPAGNGLNSKGNPIIAPKYDSTKREVTFTLRKALPKGNYTFEVSGIQDTSYVKNTMMPHTEVVEIGDTGKPTLVNAWVDPDTSVTGKTTQYIYVQFSEAVSTEGNGNALDLVKYNYTNNNLSTTDAAYASWSPMPSKSTIDLVAEDTVRINLPEVDRGKEIKPAGIRVTLVSDLEGNFIEDLVAYTDMAANNKGGEIKVTKAVATDVETIKVTFDGRLTSVVDSDFRLEGIGNTNTRLVTLEDFKLDGVKTIATFKLADEVGEDVYGKWNLVTVAQDEIASQNQFGAKVKATTEQVKDEIVSTYKDMEMLTNKEILVTFNEAIIVTDPTAVSVVKVKVDNTTVDVVGLRTDGGKLVITLKDAVEKGQEVEVNLLDANDAFKVVVDKAGNAAKDFTNYVYQD